MQYTGQTLQTHPVKMSGMSQVSKGIDAIADNAMACRVCADACLHQDMVKDLVQCIELDLACAASCDATVQMLLQPGSGAHQVMTSQLEACAKACAACAQECDKHASMHEHCRVCAESCRAAEQACRQVSQSMMQPAMA